jgi:hypothetical protein
MKIGIQYNKKNMLPLVEGVMVDYQTQKKNTTFDIVSGAIFFVW